MLHLSEGIGRDWCVHDRYYIRTPAPVPARDGGRSPYVQTHCPERTPPESPRKAAAYALASWETLTRYAEPGMGHVLIDQNSVERGIRPTKLGAKNWMYIGHPDADCARQ